MSDDFRLRQDATKAIRAKQLVEELAEPFAMLEAAYTKAWRESAPLDTQAREKLFLAINVVGKVKEHLEAVIASGGLAEKELQRLTEEAQRKRRFGIV